MQCHRNHADNLRSTPASHVVRRKAIKWSSQVWCRGMIPLHKTFWSHGPGFPRTKLDSIQGIIIKVPSLSKSLSQIRRSHSSSQTLSRRVRVTCPHWGIVYIPRNPTVQWNPAKVNHLPPLSYLELSYQTILIYLHGILDNDLEVSLLFLVPQDAYIIDISLGSPWLCFASWQTWLDLVFWKRILCNWQISKKCRPKNQWLLKWQPLHLARQVRLFPPPIWFLGT